MCEGGNMKRLILFLLLTTLLFGLLSADFEEKILSNATIEDNFHGSRVLVVLDKSISDFNKEHDAQLFGSFEKISVQDISQIDSEEVIDIITETIGEGEFRQIFQITLPGDDKQQVLNAIAILETIEGILYAGPDHLLQLTLEPDDYYYRLGDMWGLDAINAQQAWDVTTGSRNVRVGIIDTGIDSRHEDLARNWHSGWLFDGYNPTPVPSTTDNYGHGTHVAGTVGAASGDDNNGTGVVGVNWDVSLISLEVYYWTYPPGVWESSSIHAINFATNTWRQRERISILNFSMIGYGDNIPILTAVRNFPGLFVWAAANDAYDVDRYPRIRDFDIGNLISVGAINPRLDHADFSNYSTSGRYVNIYAPGVNIWSTLPNNNYGYMSGTSMAAPHVTGVAALLLSVNPSLTAYQLKSIIISNARDLRVILPNGNRQTVKFLDAYKAVTNQVGLMSHRTDLTWQNITLYGGGYNWVCFPVLDKFNKLPKQYHNGGFYDYHADDIFYNMQIFNSNKLLTRYPDPEVLTEMKWRYNDDSTFIDPSNAWYSDHKLDSRYGYKIQIEYPHDIAVTLGGFMAGKLGNEDTKIILKGKLPQAPYRETWVGYYRERSLEALRALEGIERYLIEIKTENWALNRATINDPWPTIASRRWINPGEAVSLKYVGDRDESFEWPAVRGQSSNEEYARYTQPKPSYFTYEEKEDYIPVYVELSDDMVGDNFGELALYIDGKCYGAEVMTGEEVVQINSYIGDISLDTAQVEFRIHEYISSKDSSGDCAYSGASSIMANNLKSDPNKTFYTISFREGKADMVPTTLRTSLEGNYPNPFNPSTTIKYNLSQNGNVKLQVYNIKGQIVKTLVNANQEAGFHTVVWNGEDSNNAPVASGIYFYRLETNTTQEVKRMLLMK